MFLFDTNLLSELRRPERAHPGVAAWASSIPDRHIHLSAMTLFELELGAGKIERRDPAQGRMLREWIGVVLARHGERVLPVDGDVARICAALHVPDPRSDRDSFIAATAIRHRLTVATRNVRDFAGTGAALFDPWAGGDE